MGISKQQVAFFNTFGYLTMPGLMADSVGWISEEFQKVFTSRGIDHDGSLRSCIVPFIDQSARLCTLLDDERINGLISGLLGDDFNYIAGDGNYYTGDTSWHSDGFHTVGKYLKVAFYLDPVDATSGALRVIPGTHRLEEKGNWEALRAGDSMNLWGIEQKDVPSVVLTSKPGDVVAFNHNLMHASFGGGASRRMFTLNLCRHASNEEETIDMRNFIGSMARFWADHTHSDIMKGTASPQRMRHLQQVMDNEDHLPALAAKARAEMSESARG